MTTSQHGHCVHLSRTSYQLTELELLYQPDLSTTLQPQPGILYRSKFVTVKHYSHSSADLRHISLIKPLPHSSIFHLTTAPTNSLDYIWRVTNFIYLLTYLLRRPC